jgi:hypothetical protein
MALQGVLQPALRRYSRARSSRQEPDLARWLASPVREAAERLAAIADGRGPDRTVHMAVTVATASSGGGR